ncbi:Peroxisome membrane protein, Pex16 [Metarhizium album ARSEF 1941]|uniref:Peroxisomal membrane protein PEX16 n=1 Tax=Metarhizium album (strain ARSEF 1941) TaxID=1081103 RepID=A0A0B2WKE2_METAS|nr:Peroxisome membrane protein, Pex16 [Metarhizium album ARSEF 1941]KHN94393.1 Peroxisome membrane protein, Pex16 [Metarhizium album ARSEF 1941]
MPAAAAPAAQRPRPSVGQILSMPPQWLAMYDDFITKNAGQVSQIESALRSLTYIIPGRFRDAEIASESIHSFVQLLSLYHDNLLSRPVSQLPVPPPLRNAHARYTRFWSHKSKLYRRIAMVLQMVVYTELLCEMTAKRRGGERARWKVVVLIEGIKAACRLLLLRVTRSRPLVTPVLPEREAMPEDEGEQQQQQQKQEEEDEEDEEDGGDETRHESKARLPPHGLSAAMDVKRPHEREWKMPRTGMSLPSLPDPGDISSYLLGRVLSADDIKPAAKLLNRLQGASRAAEVLHVLAPLVYAVALARSGSKTSWAPWAVGLAVECAARQLRDTSLRTTALERDEWQRRGWAMAWWAMRGAFYHNVTAGVVGAVTRRMPGFVAGILDDYEYLWENYYFSTSA